MKTTLTLLLAAAAMFLSAPAVEAQSSILIPTVVSDLTGTLRIQQPIPCVDDVDMTTPVTAGRLELTPALGTDVAGGKEFTLTRGSIAFAPFSIHRSCATIDRTRNYTSVGVQLTRAIRFTATGSGGVYSVVIPKEDFEIYEAVIVNGDEETGYKQPSEDVTGTIDFNAGTVQMHVVLATRVHFEAGCTPFGCIVNETTDGTLTADITGTIHLPDSDADGVADNTDNCRFVANPDQSPVATPIIDAPADVTIASCLDHQIGAAKAADVCDAGPVTVSNDAPAVFAAGANTVTWTAMDSQARTATDTQTVTVVDTTAPVFTSVPPDPAPTNCGPVDLGLPTAIDDCAGSPTFTNNAPADFQVGTTVVTWTATDASGNSTTATQTVTVTDLTPPTVSCTPQVPPGNSYVVSSSDACAGAPVIRLGGYVLAEGEHIKINITGQPGVRFVNVANGIRHFHVGKGEAVITATDASNNVSTAICR